MSSPACLSSRSIRSRRRSRGRYRARIVTEGARDGHTGAVAAAPRLLAREGRAGMMTMPGDIPRLSSSEIAATLAAHRRAPAFTIVPAHDDLGSTRLSARRRTSSHCVSGKTASTRISCVARPWDRPAHRPPPGDRHGYRQSRRSRRLAENVASLPTRTYAFLRTIEHCRPSSSGEPGLGGYSAATSFRGGVKMTGARAAAFSDAIRRSAGTGP